MTEARRLWRMLRPYRDWMLLGLLAALVTALSPNLMAHAGLATTDAGEALFFFLALYLFGEY
ncbi:MAG: hypothetical protein P8Y25_05365 [Chromatiaceae bacterium]